MSYSQGPYKSLTLGVVPDRPVIAGARAYDPLTRRYAIDTTDGGTGQMSVTAQKVLLRIAFGVQRPDNNTEQDREQTRQDIDSVLADMVSTSEIVNLVIDVDSERAGQQQITVSWVDPNRGHINDSIQLG